MRKLLKSRWILLALWAIVTIGFALNQPNLNQILNQKGQASISSSSPSQVAAAMLNKMSTSKGDTAILVFYNSKKLSDANMKDIQNGIDKLTSEKKTLDINNIIDPFSTPDAKDQLLSKDGTTLICQVTYSKGTRDSKTIINGFTNALAGVKTTHYITGELAINNDYLDATSKGVDKSAIITVAFILIVLIIMFRSIITPFISLFAVAIAYFCSMGIIGILINTVNFPITSLTQMFMILVLFGIGTDYNILLFNRFKEELGKGLSIDDSIIATYKTAGKTVIFSCLTVFIAFASLSFVEFPIYRSANAVAIGIAALLFELITLTPLLMKTIGKYLFWPSKHSSGHKESKLWATVTSASIKHPAISLAIVAVIIAPVIYFNSTSLSFDSLKDLSADTPSVKAFNLVADKFGRGKAMPTTIVIESKTPMDNNDDLAIIDTLTEKLKNLNGVEEVASVTQPKSDQIDTFYTSSQTKSVVNGLNSANNGVSQINDGLKKIDNSLTTPDFSGVKKLSDGTGSLETGLSAITNGLNQVNSGINQGASGADQIASGISGLKAGIASINGGLNSISSNLVTVQNGYNSLGQAYQSLSTSIAGISQLIPAINGNLAAINAKLPNDANVAAAESYTNKLSSGLSAISSGFSTANSNYNTLTSGLTALNSGLSTLTANTSSNSELVSGINELATAEENLASGLRQGSQGQQTIINNMSKLIDGAEKVKAGQDTLYGNLNTLSSGMSQLKDGISKSSNGLTSIYNGIGSANSFLNEQANGSKSFYIPNAAFGTSDLNKMLDAYMSSDRKITKLTVNLNSDPYSPAAINTISDMNNLVKYTLSGTKLSNASFGIAGPTSDTYDLNNIATHDITFTQVLVLASIFILLILVIRSFWIPVYIIGSLITAYYTAISITDFLVSKLFPGMGGLSWNVPFFSFVVIAALGVDYSIFLMTRFKEYKGEDPKEAMILAAKNVGGVVLSAAIILSGTFATLYPSNVHVLMELAICVVLGLFLLSFILLPIVIPALISIQEKITKSASSSVVVDEVKTDLE